MKKNNLALMGTWNAFLKNSVIPNLLDSGMKATAEDLKTCATLIEHLVEEIADLRLENEKMILENADLLKK